MKFSSLTASWHRLSFRLPLLIVMFAAITGVVGGSIAYYFAREGFIEAAKERAELVRNERARAIVTLVDDIKIGLASLVSRPGMARDLTDLSVEFKKLGNAQRDVVIAGYTGNSAFPPDARSAVHDLGDGSGYSAKHKEIHERLMLLLQLKQLDDILLVDSSGEVVYTVVKQSEFGTNLLSGPYRETGAAQAFRRALAAQPPWEQAFVDMAPYEPSGAPAAFMAQALRGDDGGLAGVLIFQLHNSRFRDVANHIQDLGDTGEVYLVGSDATRRSHTRFSNGALTAEKLTNEGAARSAAGFTATTITTNYRGAKVVAAYAPLDLMGVKWGIVSNIDLDEALAPLNAIAISTIVGVLTATLVIAFFGYASARRISRPLDQSLRVMDKLSRGDLHVEIAEGNGTFETRQISAALRTFHGNLLESRRLMSEVTQSQEQLMGLLDSSPTGIVVLSADNEVLFVNDPGASILGRQKSAFVGETFSFADIAVIEYEAGRFIAAARREGFVKAAQLTVRISEKGEVTLNLSVRRTQFKGKEAYLIWFDDITDALRANKELQELNTRMIALLDNTPDLIAIQGRDLRYQIASQPLAAFCGVKTWRDVIGKRPAEILPPEPASMMEARTLEILEGQAPETFHETLSRKEPTPMWTTTRRIAMRDERGSVSGVLTISRDITKEKLLSLEIEKALEDAKGARARTDAILSGAPDPIVIVDDKGIIEYVNKQIELLLSYAPQELLGRSIEGLLPERYRHGHSAKMIEFFQAGKVRAMGAGRELFALSKDGREVPVEISLSPVQAGGRSVVVASIRDVTDQKRAAQEIRESQQLLSAVIQNSATIIFVKRHGRYVMVNKAWEDMTGITADQACNQTDLEVFPDGGKDIMDNDAAILAAGKPAEYEERVKIGDKIIDFLSLKFPLFNAAGEADGLCGMSTDITSRKAAEETIKAAKDAAESATKAKSDFLAAMSHEIRTPMNGVTGMADLLAQTELSDEQRHMVRTIRESGNALITVINDILDFSKIEAGKLDIESVTMSITDAVEGVASTLTPNATKKGVRIQVFVDPNIPAVVYGDPTRLRQVLFNMGGNAVKFSNGKDVQIRAELAGRTDGDRTWVRFAVIDRGIGISKENQAKLFQAFSQAESSTTRRFGGTGLGLAICKRLTEMMNGVIGVDSREGQGSTFYVELPFRVVEGAASKQKPRDLTGLRVLLLGSDGPRAEAIDAYLTQDGAQVVYAATADEVLAVLKKDAKIDSIMVDLGLDHERQEKSVGLLRKAIAGKTPIILLQDYQNRGARIQNKDVVTVDANPIVRYRVVSAVAVAAGRASPQVWTDEDAISTVPRAKAPTPDEARAMGQLILLAEDNLTNQDVIRRQLGLLGYACEIANNGVEALNAFKSGGYALLLTDCHMPEMDGYELTGAIRALEQGAGTRFPIVAVTANALQGEAERCLAAGMDDYISKPIAMPALVAALKKWMPLPKGTTAHGDEIVVNPVKNPEEPRPLGGANDAIVVDERAIKDIFGDDPVTFKEIMLSFVGPSQDIIADIVAAHERRAAGDVKDAAHKLKSSARSIGATALADLCLALETAGKNADWDGIDEIAPKARDEFARVAVYIGRL